MAGGGRRGIYVPMPKASAYGGNLRDRIVQKYGDATVTRAEVAVLINVLIYMGVFKRDEYIEMLETMCRNIDDERRKAAGIND